MRVTAVGTAFHRRPHHGGTATAYCNPAVQARRKPGKIGMCLSLDESARFAVVQDVIC